jgi:hypothetical protein
MARVGLGMSLACDEDATGVITGSLNLFYDCELWNWDLFLEIMYFLWSIFTTGNLSMLI